MNAPPPANGNTSSAAAIAASLAMNGNGKRRIADPEYIAISEFLSSVGEVDDHDATNNNNNGGQASTDLYSGGAANQQKRLRLNTVPAKNGGAPRRPPPATAATTPRDGAMVPRARGPTTNGGHVERDFTTDLALHRLKPNAGGRERYSTDFDAFDADLEPNGLHGEDDFDDNHSDKSDKSSGRLSSSRHTKLTDLEARVRTLERDNLHLKQTLLLGKNGSVMIAGRGSRESIQRMLSERTKVVTEMVEQLNASFLTIGDASRVWHQDCRVGVGVREWDAFGRLQTISLWNMIRSVFATIAVDIVELRPHLPDGEMILTKWRIQGEIASQSQLEMVCSSEDCTPTMKVALMAIKSSDLTFTVTTYVIFQESRIAEQHHCWDQVGVFKRLFGGEIPPAVQAILTIK